jgi:AcrR family transcriptional regulator
VASKAGSAAAVRRPATKDDLFDLARRMFLAGERLSVEDLAQELGLSRATAYRWAGNADELTGKVIAGLAAAVFYRTSRDAKGKGAARVVDAMSRGMRLIASGRGYRHYLARDPERALRIVASKDGPVQGQTIALVQGLLEEEASAGRLKLPVDPHTMAYALVRIVESFLYADAIAGEALDLDKAEEIIKLMLR